MPNWNDQEIKKCFITRVCSRYVKRLSFFSAWPSVFGVALFGICSRFTFGLRMPLWLFPLAIALWTVGLFFCVYLVAEALLLLLVLLLLFSSFLAFFSVYQIGLKFILPLLRLHSSISSYFKRDQYSHGLLNLRPKSFFHSLPIFLELFPMTINNLPGFFK